MASCHTVMASCGLPSLSLLASRMRRAHSTYGAALYSGTFSCLSSNSRSGLRDSHKPPEAP